MRYKSNTFDEVLMGLRELDVLNKSMLCACGFVASPLRPLGVVVAP
jgi:hypothetical protein